MSLLSRYKKTGGFIQLLQLVETSPKDKQEKFIKLITEENPSWAEAIKQKMLTVKRICHWPKETLEEVVQRMNDLTLYVLKEDMDSDLWDRLYACIPERRRKSLIDMDQYREKAQDGEINTAYLQLLSVTRNMLSQGFLYPEKIDSTLAVPDGIEEKLGNSAVTKKKEEPEKLDREETFLRSLSETELRAEVRKLRKDLHSLRAENEKLRLLVAKLPKSA